jgi:signal recognition particle receptor subunit beta
MVQFNLALREINCKIVYFGPGLSGKTTNLEVVHQKAPEESRGVLSSIATESDRTLFFDFMPLNLGSVGGMKTKFQLYTVPGQVYYNSTRKLVLRGADGVVFVADSNPEKMAENIESLQNLEDCLREQGRSLAETPHVIQLNKRDLPGAASIDEMAAALNRHGAPIVEAVAAKGDGVVETFKALSVVVLQKVKALAEERGGAATRSNPIAAGKGGAQAPTSETPRSEWSAKTPGARPAASKTPSPASIGTGEVAAATAVKTASPSVRTAPPAPPRAKVAEARAETATSRVAGNRSPTNDRRILSTSGPKPLDPWKVWVGAAVAGGVVAAIVLALFK